MSNTPSKAEIEKLAAEHLKAFAQFTGAGDVWVEGEVAFARAVLAKWGTQPQAGAVPQGWKAVPVNPTPEMWKAAKSVPDPNPPYPPHYGLVWDAMLAASPTPPAEQQAAPKAAPGEREQAAQRLRELWGISPDDVTDPLHPRYIEGYKAGHAAGRKRAAPQQEAQEPALFVSAKQLADLVDPSHATGGSYLPARKTRAGLFTQPLYTAHQPAPAAQGDAIEHELAMLIRRIVSSARRNCEDGSNVLKLANEAWTYLVRKGLNGSPLRDAGIESDPTPPAKAADSVLEDAALWFAERDNVYPLLKHQVEEFYRQWNAFNGTTLNPRWVSRAARKQGANHD